MNCRHCASPVEHVFVDLGFAPPSNAYLTASDLRQPEKYYPLRVLVCDRCWLVQTEDHARPEELFGSDYAYFSSTSTTWLDHARQFASTIIERLHLSGRSTVIEVACNDGYLLRNFVAAGIPCLGIEPTACTAAAAERQGVRVRRGFFGEAMARELVSEGWGADLLVGNNVFAHVPDINDFSRGLKVLLKPSGTITLEFPHLVSLLENALFDTIYHEHYSYLSLHAVGRIFACAGLRVQDVESLPTHGGSLRVHGVHTEDTRPTTAAVTSALADESRRGLQVLETYGHFQERSDQIKNGLLSFLIEAKQSHKKVAAYGAAAKGNTLLNYAGVKPDLLPFVCDAAIAKQGKYMPGSHIPILPPSVLDRSPPDYLLILPWNIAAEVRERQAHLAAQGMKFVTAVPRLEVF